MVVAVVVHGPCHVVLARGVHGYARGGPTHLMRVSAWVLWGDHFLARFLHSDASCVTFDTICVTLWNNLCHALTLRVSFATYDQGVTGGTRCAIVAGMTMPSLSSLTLVMTQAPLIHGRRGWNYAFVDAQGRTWLSGWTADPTKRAATKEARAHYMEACIK